MKSHIIAIITLLILFGCTHKEETILNPTLRNNSDILGRWVLDDGQFVFTFIENGIVEMNEISSEGTILDHEIMDYNITDEAIHIYCSELSESNCRDDLTIYYIPLDNFSTLSLPRIVAHYSDGREDIDLSLENIKLNRKD